MIDYKKEHVAFLTCFSSAFFQLAMNYCNFVNRNHMEIYQDKPHEFLKVDIWTYFSFEIVIFELRNLIFDAKGATCEIFNVKGRLF